MFTNFARSGAVQSALIHGDMRTAKRSARILSDYVSAEGFGGESVEYVARVRRTAMSIAQADRLEEATRQAGNLAAACGSCHAATGGGPRLSLMTPLPMEGGLIGHMRRHLWSVDRMWEGLVGANQEFWEAGARGLLEQPLHAELPPERYDVARFAERVHELGRQALAANTAERRAEVYGELIATCAGCHYALGESGG